MRHHALQHPLGRLFAAGILTLALAAACGGSDDDGDATATPAATSSTASASEASQSPTVVAEATAAATVAPTASATEAASPAPSGASGSSALQTETESIYFDLDSTPGFQSLIAAASINNYADRTLEGAEVRIDLLDAAGANVGSSTFALPRIGPVQSYVLVIQASSVGADKLHSMTYTAEPASLTATIVKPGELVDGPGDALTFEDLKVYKSSTTPDAYELEATLVTGVDTEVGDIAYKTAIVLDADKNVVGLGLGRADTTGMKLTDVLPPGTRIPVKATVLNPTAEVAYGLFNVFAEP